MRARFNPMHALQEIAFALSAEKRAPGPMQSPYSFLCRQVSAFCNHFLRVGSYPFRSCCFLNTWAPVRKIPD